MDASSLRKEYPVFSYDSYSITHENNTLCISFDFSCGPTISFHPTLTIQNIPQEQIQRMENDALSNLIFNIGLVEMISYWKATCSKNIVIKAGYLDKRQTTWLHTLILKGMGEYFYQNKINFTGKNFLIITSESPPKRLPKRDLGAPKSRLGCLNNRILVPVGGGKDSAVTLQILKEAKMEIVPFLLNPKKEQLDILEVAGIKNPVIVERILDKKLLELNQAEFLNGHTPFSALLAMMSTLVATLFSIKYIALSNEASSNEGNVKYLGHHINHQYSKTYDFEKQFRLYSKKYLSQGIEYFSFLRPLNELQIARIFASYPKYFPAFLSCNEANKTYSGRKPAFALRQARGYGEARWCGQCAKCLFAFAVLYPFTNETDVKTIFGKKNLFEYPSLIPLMEELIGTKKFKPFECVGTREESMSAFFMSAKKETRSLPVLLSFFEKRILPKQKGLFVKTKRLLFSWNKKHFLLPQFREILKEKFKEQHILNHPSPKIFNAEVANQGALNGKKK